MKVLDLFSGIGGFSLGLDRAGMETVAFCENDKFCQKVLAKHWPNVPVHNNIEELDGREYKGTVDLVCGGFPCQPFSVAGNQRGAEDDRALWPEMLRVIREVEPAWVIGENVSGIIHMELDNVLSDLEGAGYSCQTFVIPACGVDAKHRRDRVWIIGRLVVNTNDTGDRTFRGEVDENRKETIERREEQSQFELSGSSEDVADADSSHIKGRGVSSGVYEKHPIANSRGTQEENVADAECLRQQGQGEHEHSGNQEAHRERQASHVLDVGFREKRGAQPRMGGMVDGVSRWLDEPEGIPRVMGKVPDRVHRLKALGNAVVPQVVEVLGKIIME